MNPKRAGRPSKRLLKFLEEQAIHEDVHRRLDRLDAQVATLSAHLTGR